MNIYDDPPDVCEVDVQAGWGHGRHAVELHRFRVVRRVLGARHLQKVAQVIEIGVLLEGLQLLLQRPPLICGKHHHSKCWAASFRICAPAARLPGCLAVHTLGQVAWDAAAGGNRRAVLIEHPAGA